jgi:hypothetical protein
MTIHSTLPISAITNATPIVPALNFGQSTVKLASYHPTQELANSPSILLGQTQAPTTKQLPVRRNTNSLLDRCAGMESIPPQTPWSIIAITRRQWCTFLGAAAVVVWTAVLGGTSTC